jgi:hypothetical protein
MDWDIFQFSYYCSLLSYFLNVFNISYGTISDSLWIISAFLPIFCLFFVFSKCLSCVFLVHTDILLSFHISRKLLMNSLIHIVMFLCISPLWISWDSCYRINNWFCFIDTHYEIVNQLLIVIKSHKMFLIMQMEKFLFLFCIRIHYISSSYYNNYINKIKMATKLMAFRSHRCILLIK